jgi:hypothetical protein
MSFAALRLVALAIGVALTFVTRLAAQEEMLVREKDGRRLCTLRATVCAGGNWAGGFGFARIEVENLDQQGHEVRVVIGTPRWADNDVHVERTIQLLPSERAVTFLPLPTPFPRALLQFFVSGTETVSSLNLNQGSGVTGLLLSDRPDANPLGMVWLQRLPAELRGPPILSQVPAAEAPSDWRLYTGFHAVLVDSRSPVPADVQEALRRAAFAGLVVAVAAPHNLSAGPLRSLLGAALPGTTMAHGLGTLLVMPPVDELAAARSPVVPVGQGPLPVAPALQYEAEIPGLGEAPVRVFLSVIVLFALLAGPVNFILLRRWRRPMLALVTVPALGFGTTLMILAYGFWNDGFGVRGVETSWTLLDQGRHEAATICARTLFTGQAPGSFAFGADAMLLAPHSLAEDEHKADRWSYDAGTAQLDGGALPSRTPTPLVTVQQGVARQRLVCQREGEVLRLLTDGGVEPIGMVVVRDFDGGYWAGEAPQLRPIAADAVAAKLAQMQADGTELERLAPHRGRRRGGDSGGNVGSFPVGALAERCLPSGELVPGSYVAVVESPPWLERHGLEIAVDSSRHFVHGRLGPEDLQR